MTNYIFIFLFFLGSILGSYCTMLLHRIRNKKSGMVAGRSECPKCKHVLGVLDLIPIFSYILLRGKCRYCQEKISKKYFITEIFYALTFGILGTVFINSFPYTSELILPLTLFLSLLFVINAVSIYDVLFLEIPLKIFIYFLRFLIILYLGIFFFWGNISEIFPIPGKEILIVALGLYIFFYLQIFIPGAIYAGKNKNKKLFTGLLKDFFSIPVWMLGNVFLPEKIQKKIPLFKEEDEEMEFQPWIGGGDFWFIPIIAILWGIKIGIIWLMLAYILGSIIGILVLLFYKKRVLPFGPFLGYGLILAYVFHEEIISFLFYYFL